MKNITALKLVPQFPNWVFVPLENLDLFPCSPEINEGLNWVYWLVNFWPKIYCLAKFEGKIYQLAEWVMLSD